MTTRRVRMKRISMCRSKDRNLNPLSCFCIVRGTTVEGWGPYSDGDSGLLDLHVYVDNGGTSQFKGLC